MKYMAIIELDEKRTTCINCPLCDSNDNCNLQPDKQFTDDWNGLLSTCPLKEVE